MEVFTVKELSNYLNCSISTVRSLVRKREIPFFRIGSKLYFKKSAIDLWIKNQEIKNMQESIQCDKKTIIKKAIDLWTKNKKEAVYEFSGN